jgi:hypothetical protein
MRLRCRRGSSIAVPTEKSYQLNSGAPPATILNGVMAIGVWHTFLNLHRLVAYKTDHEIDQRALVVVQMRSLSHVFPVRAFESKKSRSLVAASAAG